MGSTRTSGLVNCPPSIYHSPRYSNHTVNSSCVPSVLRLQPSDFTSSEHTICIPDETFCAVVSHSKPYSVLISGVHPVPGLRGDLPSQHFLSKRDKLLCRLLAVQSLKGRLSVTTFLAPGQDASGVLHQPWHDRRVVAEWFLRSAFDVALDGPDDSTNQHHRVLDEAVRFFVSFHCVFRGDFCFARFSYSISERNGCRFCVALQCDFTVDKQVNEFRSSTALRLLSSVQRCS